MEISSTAEVAQKIAQHIKSSPTEDQMRKIIKDVLEPLPKASQARVVEGVKKIFEPEFERRDHLVKRQSAYKSMEFWLDDLIARGPILEANQATRLHKLFELGITENLQDPKAEPNTPGDMLTDFNHAFVVKHDWAAAFSNAEGIEGELKLPYELCAFEFRINGKSVTALAWDTELAIPILKGRLGFTLAIESEGLWFDYGGSKDNPDDLLIPFVWKQLQAICVALDADVAVHEVVRAPAALNAKRARTGKPPIRDHHIIDLARRHRIANPSGGHSEPRKVRLHFRRGHWRHFETHKTWIKWMLVGNPALGFIQQRYSL